MIFRRRIRRYTFYLYMAPRKKTCADVAKKVKVNIGAKLISKLEELKEAAVSDQIAEVAAVMVV